MKEEIRKPVEEEPSGDGFLDTRNVGVPTHEELVRLFKKQNQVLIDLLVDIGNDPSVKEATAHACERLLRIRKGL